MAEDLASVSQRLHVTAVPTVVVTRTTAPGRAPTVEGRIDGAKPVDLVTLVRRLVGCQTTDKLCKLNYCKLYAIVIFFR